MHVTVSVVVLVVVGVSVVVFVVVSAGTPASTSSQRNLKPLSLTVVSLWKFTVTELVLLRSWVARVGGVSASPK